MPIRRAKRSGPRREARAGRPDRRASSRKWNSKIINLAPFHRRSAIAVSATSTRSALTRCCPRPADRNRGGRIEVAPPSPLALRFDRVGRAQPMDPCLSVQGPAERFKIRAEAQKTGALGDARGPVRPPGEHVVIPAAFCRCTSFSGLRYAPGFFTILWGGPNFSPLESLHFSISAGRPTFALGRRIGGFFGFRWKRAFIWRSRAASR